MRRFFSGVSSVALLLCLTTQTVFSMSEEKEDHSLRGAAAASSSAQGISAGDSRSPEEQRVMVLVGTQKLMSSIPPDAEVVGHYMFSSYTRDNYFDLMKKLDELLKVSALKGRISNKGIVDLCDRNLKSVAYPFKLYIKDASTLLVMMVGGEETSLVIFTPAERTQEETFDAARAPIQGPRVSLNVPIIDCLRISETVCRTRGRLLELKREALAGIQAEECLKEEIESYKKFLDYISQFDSHITSQDTRIHFLKSQYEAYQNVSSLIEELGRFYLSKDQQDAYIEAVAAQSESLSHHLNVTRALLKIDPSVQNLVWTQKTLIDGLFSLSVVECGFYLTRDGQSASDAYHRAFTYNRQLKEIGEKDLYKKNQKNLERMIPKKTSLSLRRGPRFNDVLAAFEEFDSQKSGDAILLEHRQFSSFMRESLKNKESSSEQIRGIQDRIVCFENKMIGRDSSSLLSASQLDTFYQEYKKALMGRPELVDVTNLLIEFFMMTGRLEQAVNHIDSFKKVCGGADQTKIFKEMDLKLAVLKALQGDPEEFLSLIEGASQDLAERERARLAQKAERERRRSEIIRASVAAAEKDAQRRLTLTKSQPSKHLGVKLTPEIPVSSKSLFETDISPQETKVEKVKRHQQSLARKEQERRERAEREAARLRKQEALQQDAAAADDFPLEEEGRKYVPFDPEIRARLTTLQKRLENEMEAESWNFTREELETYYAAFGCKISQRGSHVKAALPKFEVFELPDGTPLVINFNFEGSHLEGGAFGFGEWTDTVPRYLHPQILEARRRIQAFKLFVNEEARRALADQGDHDDGE
ncbi:MAG: hypothetical protein B7Y25_04385 [Alphaproteobacteria bacterium 16-39-46]|nr:MAG: hypothetical protein B7Y25_04385 [Alphaproteobacteria bacterium 16-39-46]OZA43017.1 MAG: hypothetical protein B7X84_04305 [Alphaproteobacteria bacterium 17-39-52]HQS84139.1 hypothetical protein [Alphaproteobacteria bacterium]HQS93997.1 hypothetical protein [Alphaproteobacteria bacterium]